MDKAPAKAEKARPPGKSDASGQAEEAVPKTGEEVTEAEAENQEAEAAPVESESQAAENQVAEGPENAEEEGS